MRLGLLVLFGTLAFAAGLGLAAATTADRVLYARSEPLDETFHPAFLAWRDNQGVIDWGTAGTTADPGGPSAAPIQAVDAWAGWGVRTHTGMDGAAGQAKVPADVFTSDGSPRELFLNVSRSIHFDLFVKKPDSGCPHLDVELLIGTELLAGALDVQTLAYPAPAAPAGHCLWSYRLHAERELVPAGSILSVRIIHQGQVDPFLYGLGGDHHSTIWFPTYAPQEALLRRPAASDASPPAAAALPFFLAPALGILSRGRKRARAMAALLVLSATFSGCFGGSPSVATDSEDGGKATQTILPTDGPDGAGDGTLVGLVSDYYGYPIGGAFLLVVGLPHNGRTDGRGQYQIANLPPGVHGIRVDRTDYVTFEGSFEIVAGRTTRLDLQLVEVNDKGPEGRLHPHDNWGTKTKIDVFESDVTPQAPTNYFYGDVYYDERLCIGTNAYSSVQPGGTFCRFDLDVPLLLDGKPNLIQPGTREITGVVTWEGTNAIDRVGIGFVDALEERRTWNATLMYPRASGQTTHIATNWDETDVGHQTYSQWNFFLYVPSNARGHPSGKYPGPGFFDLPRATAQVLPSKFHVTLTIHKGIVPLGPAHRDFWGGNQTLTVVPTSDVDVTPCFCDFPIWDYFGWSASEKKRFVPPETVWLEMDLKQTGTPLPLYNWRLLYHSAAFPTMADGRNLAGFQPVEHTSVDGATRHYRLVLKDLEADPFYARTSGWWWAMDDQADGINWDASTVSFSLTVVAHRDAVPA